VSDVIRLRLTTAQTALLSPLVLEAGKNHQNMIFFSVVVPFRSQQEDIFWELQVTAIFRSIRSEDQKVSPRWKQLTDVD
jgi:hypothetical protein